MGLAGEGRRLVGSLSYPDCVPAPSPILWETVKEGEDVVVWHGMKVAGLGFVIWVMDFSDSGKGQLRGLRLVTEEEYRCPR